MLGNTGITLDRLFRASKIRELGDQKVVVRASSDYENMERSLACVTASARMQKKLEDPESPESLSFLAPLNKLSLDKLIQNLIQLRRRELESEAQDKIKPRFIPFPDDASDEERRTVILEREAQSPEIDKQRKAYVDENLERFEEVAKTKDEKLLLAECRSKTISAACSSAYIRAWSSETIYMFCEKVGGGKFFSREEAERLDYRIANLLLEDFREVNDIDPLALMPSSATE